MVPEELRLPADSDEDVALAHAVAAMLGAAATPLRFVTILAADRPFLERRLAALLPAHMAPLVPSYLRRTADALAERPVAAALRMADVPLWPKAATGMASMDRLLCGGLSPGHITEFVGAAGVGKTQLVMQLLVLAAAHSRPAFLFASEAFPAQRLSQLAAEHAQRAPAAAVVPLAAADILARIFVRKVSSVEQLQLALRDPRFLGAVQGGPSLVALDSVAALAAGDADDDATSGPRGHRSDAGATAIGAALHTFLAATPGAACAVTNQVRACFGLQDALPALGLQWAQAVHTRLDVRRLGACGKRVVSVVCSPHVPPGQCLFEIDGTGVVDVPQ